MIDEPEVSGSPHFFLGAGSVRTGKGREGHDGDGECGVFGAPMHVSIRPRIKDMMGIAVLQLINILIV